jgi:hypothetical protein
VIDANGVVRDDSLVYIHELFFSDTPDKMIETLVAEAEKASKREGGETPAFRRPAGPRGSDTKSKAPDR